MNRCLFLFVLLPAAAQAQGAAIAETSVISANRRLADESTGAAELRQILTERASTMRELMQTNPVRALALAMPESTARKIRRAAPDALDLIEMEGEWDEPVQVVVHDDFANGTSRTLLSITLNNGPVDLFLDGEVPSLKCGDRVQMKGIRSGNIIAAKLSGIQASVSPCTTIGDQKTAIILLNFPSFTLPANINAAFMQSVYFAAGSHSQSSYWLEASYGLTSSSGQVFGPFSLGTDFTCGQSNSIRDAAIVAADGALDFRAFNRIVLVLPRACGGLGSIGCSSLTSPSKGIFNASVIWLGTDSLATNDLGVCSAVHEGGHNLGLNHASSLQFGSEQLGPPGSTGTHSEYGDNFSLMGVCFSFNGSYLLGHYAAQHKNILGWLPDTNIQTVQSNGTFTLLPLENATSGLQALRVERGVNTNLWLWLEYRRPLGYDATIQPYTSQPFSGVLVHYEDPSNTAFNQYTRLLDFTAAATPGKFNDAALAVGQTWSDPYTNLTIQVTSATASGTTVSVRYDSPCNSITPGTRGYTATAAANETVAVTTPAGCAWSAVSNAAWIAINGSTSTSVTYSIIANTSATQRSSTISIGRQLFYITQASTNNPPSPVSISPQGSGTVGIAQTFTAVFSDLDGFANLTTMNILFNTTQASTAAACYLQYNRTNNFLFFYDDNGLSATATNPGVNIVKSNTQCSLAYQGSSVITSGNTLTLTLPVTFTSPFIGVKKIYMSAQDAAGADSGWVQIGSFEVKSATANYTISGQVTIGGAALSAVTMTFAGGAAGTRITDDSGSYSFSGLPSGLNYTVTPSLANFSFTPAGTTINNLASNVIANFTATRLPGTPDKAGVSYSGLSLLDLNGNYGWDGTSVDRQIFWSTGQAGEVPVYGDWNGDGRKKAGVYANGTWLLDYNGNGVWDGPNVDKLIYWSQGLPGEVPVTGDWNGDGKTKLGVIVNGVWVLDYNGNYAWDGPGLDKMIYWSLGQAGEVPVTGDWNGNGKTKVGIFVNGAWVLDYNGDYIWNGPALDKSIYWSTGLAGESPVTGDWNGAVKTKIAIYRNGTWIIDYNGNFAWDGTSIDKLSFFGGPEYVPVVGDWNGSGTSKMGAFASGLWALDVNGNYAWDPPTDKIFTFGATGQKPIVGKW